MKKKIECNEEGFKEIVMARAEKKKKIRCFGNIKQQKFSRAKG